ncbi:hypothetical protein ACFE04_008154 [Oxalis oulophora]
MTRPPPLLHPHLLSHYLLTLTQAISSLTPSSRTTATLLYAPSHLCPSHYNNHTATILTKSRLTDPPPRDCYAECKTKCQAETAKWLRWKCPLKCISECPMWGDPPLDTKVRVDEKCKLACINSSCANISTPNNPDEDKVKQCAVGCSKNCIAG